MSIAQSSLAPPVAGVEPLFRGDALARADRRATERHHLPSIVLMERAGVGAAELIRANFDVRAATVVCGAGNNGGDGYVVARHLADAGWDVQIATLRGMAPRTPDATTMAAAARSVGLRGRRLDAAMLRGRRVIVDALLGVGARGAPREPVADAIAAINRSSCPVVALDVPSGVDADTGVVASVAVRAKRTVTFHGDKVGLRVAPGREHSGVITVLDIGIPAPVRSRPSAWLLLAGSAPVPTKRGDGDKYAAGAVLVVAGSPGMTGAGVLAARATLRSGGGLTVAAVPAGVQRIFAEQVVEVMAAPIPDVAGTFGAASVEAVLEQAGRVGAVALGPGLGRNRATTAFVRALLDAVDLPCVIDADGLWHLGRRPTWLRARRAATIVTPHAGEAARLLGCSRAEVEAGRLAAARELARLVGGIAVVKGPGAVVADATGEFVVDGIGTSALATAGSGDVLTGVVACMLAKGLDPLAAAATAVRVHSRTGQLAAKGDGTIAGDLVEWLPEAVAE